jgi:tetratricopeptide (TPR) repeat protein
MENSRSQQQVVILDCCFSGGFAKGMKAKGNAVNISAQLGGEGRAVLTSSSSTQYSFEHKDSDLSVYTRYLVEGIESGEADLDSDGWIGIQELHEYTSWRVRDVVSEMKPEFYCAREGFKIPFTQAPERDPRDVYWRKVDGFARKGDIVFVPYNLLDHARAWLSMQPRPDYRVLPITRDTLDTCRNNLGLSAAAAEEIEILALNPHREHYQSLQKYERQLRQEIRQKKTLNLAAQERLREYKRALGLDDADVNRIEQLILTQSVSQPLDRGRPAMPIPENAKVLLALGSVTAVVLGAAALATWQTRTPQFSSQQLSPLPLSPSEVPASPIPSVSPSPIPDSPPALASPSEQPTESIAARFFSEGQRKAAAKQWSEAIKGFDQAIAQAQPDDPQRHVYYGARGESRLQLSKSQEAIADYTQAIDLKTKLQPDDSLIYLYYSARGNSYLQLSKYQDAITDYTTAIKYKNDDPILYRNLGAAYFRADNQKNVSKALENYNEAIDLIDLKRGF